MAWKPRGGWEEAQELIDRFRHRLAVQHRRRTFQSIGCSARQLTDSSGKTLDSMRTVPGSYHATMEV